MVVDTEYYLKNEIVRGDMVYVEIPKEVADKTANGNDGPGITRVKGLPGEKFEIKNGQVYIDGNVLDTFYGHEYKWAGKAAEKVTSYSIDAITIPEDRYFLTGDNWWRSPIHESIPKEYIKGKVIGYQE